MNKKVFGLLAWFKVKPLIPIPSSLRCQDWFCYQCKVLTILVLRSSSGCIQSCCLLQRTFPALLRLKTFRLLVSGFHEKHFRTLPNSITSFWILRGSGKADGRNVVCSLGRVWCPLYKFGLFCKVINIILTFVKLITNGRSKSHPRISQQQPCFEIESYWERFKVP